MSQSAQPPTIGETIRLWAPVAVILIGGIGTWFSLTSKVERIEVQHAEWRQKQAEQIARLTTAIEREQADTRSLMIDIARLATSAEAIREELRRQAALGRRTENNGFAPAAREVP